MNSLFMMRGLLFALFTALQFVQPLPLLAHGDLGGQIDEVTAEIAARPSDAQLFLKRGELHRNVELFLFAGDDFAQAEKLDPSLTLVHLARARNYLEWRKPALGLSSLDRYLASNPAGQLAALAHEVRGKLLVALERPLEAASEFTLAIDFSTAPSPDVFLYRVAAYESAGNEYFDIAIQSLDTGIARLGPIVSLIQPALDLELRLQRYDAALARVDQLAAAAARPESWLARRGEILLQSGRTSEAHEAFQLALEKIASLSARHRNTAATQQIERQVRSRLQQLAEAKHTARNSLHEK